MVVRVSENASNAVIGESATSTKTSLGDCVAFSSQPGSTNAMVVPKFELIGAGGVITAASMEPSIPTTSSGRAAVASCKTLSTSIPDRAAHELGEPLSGQRPRQLGPPRRQAAAAPPLRIPGSPGESDSRQSSDSRTGSAGPTPLSQIA